MSSSWESRVSGSRGKYLPATTGSSGSISVDYDRQLLAGSGLSRPEEEQVLVGIEAVFAHLIDFTAP